MGTGYERLLTRLEAVRTLGVSLGLDRVRAALAAVGSPERTLRAIHIAGTNGKGSTSAMAEAILRAAGMRTGLYTSPHLARFTERIRIEGREVDGELLARLDEAVAASGVPLTYFEVATVLAFRAFAEAQVDVAVLETGLGGRLDATTACHPVACAITSIALDHVDVLGPTLADIAREKAGIAKPGVPLHLGPVPDEAEREIARVAGAVGAPLRRFGVDFAPPPMPPALPGAHQAANAALAVALARATAADVGRGLPDAAIVAGLAGVRWPGRLEWLAPDLLLDCAHNEEGAQALRRALPGRGPRALVLSVVRGKDAAGVLAALLPAFDAVVVTRSSNERALAPEALAALCAATPGAPRPEIVAEPLGAVTRARALVAAEGGAVVVAGSIFLVGDVRSAILGEPRDPGGGDPLP